MAKTIDTNIDDGFLLFTFSPLFSIIRADPFGKSCEIMRRHRRCALPLSSLWIGKETLS